MKLDQQTLILGGAVAGSIALLSGIIYAMTGSTNKKNAPSYRERYNSSDSDESSNAARLYSESSRSSDMRPPDWMRSRGNSIDEMSVNDNDDYNYDNYLKGGSRRNKNNHRKNNHRKNNHRKNNQTHVNRKNNSKRKHNRRGAKK